MFNWKKKNFSRRHYRRGYNFYRRQNLVSSNRQPSSSRRNARNSGFSKRINFSKIIIFVFLLVFLYIAYYFFYSPNFRITDIEIKGRENISEYALRNIIEEQFNKSRFLIFNQDNILMFNKRLTRKNIKNSYVLDKLLIKKEYPHKLYVEIEEKVSTVVWVSQHDNIEHYYYLDLNGVILGEIPISEIERMYAKEKINLGEGEEEELIKISEKEEKEQTILPLIYDQSNSEVKIKEPVLENKVINFIINLYQKFPEDFSEISIKNFATLEPNSSRVHLVTEEGYEIYFESDNDLNSQLHNLKIVLEDKIKNTNSIQYIDLRFDDRVYYK